MGFQSEGNPLRPFIHLVDITTCSTHSVNAEILKFGDYVGNWVRLNTGEFLILAFVVWMATTFIHTTLILVHFNLAI